MKILFTWEFGANLGHLARDYPLAVRLVELGHEVTFVVPDPIKAERFSSKFRYIEAPHHKSTEYGAPINYSSMLLMLGFSNPKVHRVIEAWIDLFNQELPDRVIINHSFTALLVAKYLRIPTLVIGTAWEIPPVADIQPSWGYTDLLTLERIDQRLMSIVKPYTDASRLHEIFGDSHITTIPELDFHSREASYIGSLGSLADMPTASFDSSRDKIFAYIRTNHVSYHETLSALNASGCEVLLYAADLTPPQGLLVSKMYPKIRILATPQNIEKLKPDLVLCYGTTTVNLSIQLGIPVLMLPNILEQKLTGDRLNKTNAGLSLPRYSNIQAGIYQALDCKFTALTIAKEYENLNAVDFLMEKLCLTGAAKN